MNYIILVSITKSNSRQYPFVPTLRHNSLYFREHVLSRDIKEQSIPFSSSFCPCDNAESIDGSLENEAVSFTGSPSGIRLK